MQQIYKSFFFNYYHISYIYKAIALLINSILIFLFLSGCNILPQNNIENFLIMQYQKIKKLEIKKHINKIDNNAYNVKKYNHKICRGEKISILLNESGVDIDEIFKLISIDPTLNKIKVNQYFSWTVNKFKKLLKLKWNISDTQTKIYKRTNNNFLISNIFAKNVLINKNVLVKKNSNFFRSASQSGLNPSEINNVIQAIQWQVDFQKLNAESNFNLVFSHNLLDNKNMLLGVKLNNGNKKYYSIRAFNGNFYDINGCREKSHFINFSFLKKYRITSEFNLHRLHPVTHRITRHLGVDLAMPQGTPILATSNGTVIKARFNKIAGFYIALKNEDHYVTRYMHLKKILVKLGEKVILGQKIALSGNTGRTTGPHLHYEIWINNHAVNPMHLKSIFSTKLTEQEKKIYLEESKEILKKLQ